MADERQLQILKQGAKIWNAWRNENPEISINLHDINFSNWDLKGVNFERIVFSNTVFDNADLSNARLDYCSLGIVDFDKTNLSDASFYGTSIGAAKFIENNLINTKFLHAQIRSTSFNKAIFNKANFHGAKIIDSGFYRADFNSATFTETSFINAVIKGSDFTNAKFSNTVLSNTNLDGAIGLEEVFHMSPSSLSTDTIQHAKGTMPDIFLRGCGLSDLDIEYTKLYNPTISNEEINKIVYKIYDLRATQALQISPLFISHSHADKNFVDFIDTAFTEKGVRFWRDIHDLKAGKIETQIDYGIRHNPTVLLILSKNSLNSDWVQHEVRIARDLEKELGRDVLCPIALDAQWKNSHWPKRILEQIMEYNILDFSDWENKLAFEENFTKLLNGLNIFYK